MRMNPLRFLLCLFFFLSMGTVSPGTEPLLRDDWAERLANVVKDPSRLQETFLYPAPKVMNRNDYRKKYSSWLKYERTFKREGADLHGWFYERRKKPLIIYYGANTEDVSDELWWMQGLKKYAFLLVNYRGYGLSTGKPAEKECVSDALAVLDRILKETRRSAGDVILIGRSLGTGVATQVAAQRPVGRLILITPYDSIESVAKRHFWFMPVSRYLTDHWNSISHAARVKAKTTLIVASKDGIIPPVHAKELQKSFMRKVNYVEIPGANHMDIVSNPGFASAFAEALK